MIKKQGTASEQCHLNLPALQSPHEGFILTQGTHWVCVYRETRLSWDLRVDMIRQEKQQAAAKGTRGPSEHVLSCTQFGLKSRIRFQAKGHGLTVYHGNLTALTRWVSAGGIPQGNTFPLKLAGTNENALNTHSQGNLQWFCKQIQYQY